MLWRRTCRPEQVAPPNSSRQRRQVVGSEASAARDGVVLSSHGRHTERAHCAFAWLRLSRASSVRRPRRTNVSSIGSIWSEAARGFPDSSCQRDGPGSSTTSAWTGGAACGRQPPRPRLSIPPRANAREPTLNLRWLLTSVAPLPAIRRRAVSVISSVRCCEHHSGHSFANDRPCVDATLNLAWALGKPEAPAAVTSVSTHTLYMDLALCDYTEAAVRALRARPGLLDLLDAYMAVVSEAAVEQVADSTADSTVTYGWSDVVTPFGAPAAGRRQRRRRCAARRAARFQPRAAAHRH